MKDLLYEIVRKSTQMITYDIQYQKSLNYTFLQKNWIYYKNNSNK